MELPRSPAPRLARVRQHLSVEHIEDVPRHLRRKLDESGRAAAIEPGHRIAITAGSRGLGGVVEIVRCIVDWVRDAGGDPFVIPAMGSHGGATAEGQKEILRRLGVTRESVGAPVEATMDTVVLGTAENGAQVHLDRHAAEADGVIVVGRVKTHPESAGELAGGLLKMTTIGLGKQRGAHEAHSHGLWESVRAVPRLTLERGGVLLGVAVVENAYRQPLEIEVVGPNYDAFLDADMRLLNVAKSHLARIPFDRLDLLVVDELGKNISGAGMDPNVIGHWRVSGGRHLPDYKRIVVLSLTPESLGNGIGIGMADFTTRRFEHAYDPEVTYINVLTATESHSNPREASLPLALASDREAIEVALFSALAGDDVRMCRIRNTDALEELWVSEGLMDEVKEHPKLSVVDPPAPMRFDDDGNLLES